MGGVTDDNDVLEVVIAGNVGKATHLLPGGKGIGFSNDGGKGNAVSEEVIATDSSFGDADVLVCASSEGNNGGSNLTVVEGDGVIEAGMVDGRGTAGVFGGTEDGDRVRRLRLVFRADLVDAVDNPASPGERNEKKEGQK